jgi:hypothetical protein
MGELAIADDYDTGPVWTDEACQAFIQDFEARRLEAKAGDSYGDFMIKHAGTFPVEVILYIDEQSRGGVDEHGQTAFIRARQEGRATHLPAGELARAFPKKPQRLPGVSIVAVEHKNR